MSRALIGLGSNLGNRQETLDRAVAMLADLPGTQVVARSSWLRTAPVGGPAGQGEFLNGAVALTTSLEPRELHEALRAIETNLGRRRHERWAAREIDLDLLLYDEQVLHTPELTVPHPRMAFRQFVIGPAAEAAPDMLHRPTGWTLKRLHEHLVGADDYVAITGVAGGAPQIARAVSAQINWRLIEEPAPQPWQSGERADAGRALADELELLLHRARLLSIDAFRRSAQAVVSGFWFDESLAAAELAFDDSRLETFRGAWQAAAASVVLPKLLVVVANEQSASKPVRSGWSQSQLDQFSAAMQALCNRAGIGPVLKVDGRDQQKAISEIVAAVQAMSSS